MTFDIVALCREQPYAAIALAAMLPSRIEDFGLKKSNGVPMSS